MCSQYNPLQTPTDLCKTRSKSRGLHAARKIPFLPTAGHMVVLEIHFKFLQDSIWPRCEILFKHTSDTTMFFTPPTHCCSFVRKKMERCHSTLSKPSSFCLEKILVQSCCRETLLKIGQNFRKFFIAIRPNKFNRISALDSTSEIKKKT